MLYRCVQCALMKSQDYREDVKHTNWARVKSEMTLTADDLEMVWFFLKKEVGHCKLFPVLMGRGGKGDGRGGGGMEREGG